MSNLILIVEDNEMNLKLARDLLQSSGYETIEATTAEDGIRMAKESMPALILMDIQLPGMNGMEALGHLRADPKTGAIPAIGVQISDSVSGTNWHETEPGAPGESSWSKVSGLGS